MMRSKLVYIPQMIVRINYEYILFNLNLYLFTQCVCTVLLMPSDAEFTIGSPCSMISCARESEYR